MRVYCWGSNGMPSMQPSNGCRHAAAEAEAMQTERRRSRNRDKPDGHSHPKITSTMVS